ncbi:uncharacterized protein LOC110454967 [Mizuhopecten yessoensis]|uniref:uncharacterized protein LOC110454967 n=1 Tax=Mizuhopecten yessoensis TaxID=6573 RepID=UPI000B45A747|nr:uncharacterized protein LOC110454967 [Mizuhopecten yessoensis]
MVTVRWPSRKIWKYRYGDEVTLQDTSGEQAQASGYEGNKFEPGNTLTLSSDTHSKPYKKVNFRPYSTYIRDSNTQFLKLNAFDYPLRQEIQDSVPEVRSIPEPAVLPNSIPEVQSIPELDKSIPSVWSYQQEDKVKWTPFDTCNTRKLEPDWSKQRKTTMVSVNNKSYRVVFSKRTMHSSGGNTDGKQLKCNVKREQKNEQDVKHTFD